MHVKGNPYKRFVSNAGKMQGRNESEKGNKKIMQKINRVRFIYSRGMDLTVLRIYTLAT